MSGWFKQLTEDDTTYVTVWVPQMGQVVFAHIPIHNGLVDPAIDSLMR